jgi:hypothetical protein
VTAEEARDFMEDQALTARLISVLLREVGDTPADAVIGWMARDGMVGNALAVTVATHVYARYVAKAESTADTIVADLIGYYQMLGKALVKAGVQI